MGIGSSVPKKVLSNSDLEKMVDTSDEWIIKRTGISERRILDKDTPSYTIGADAAKKALLDSKLEASDIDLIIVTTSTPDYLTPSTACIIQKEIGAVNAAAFDMNAACTGFVYGLTVAQQFIKTGYYKHIMIVACEGLSKVTDWTNRGTCVLFGDGAGAVILGEVEEGFGIVSTYISADGSMGDNITIPCCTVNEADVGRRTIENKMTLWQEGQEVFKFAVKAMPAATEKLLEETSVSIEEIKYIFPHQANIRIIDSAAKRLNIPNERVYKTIHKYGNISSASIPVALDEAYRENLLSKGDNLVFVGFGGGLTWGAALFKWNK